VEAALPALLVVEAPIRSAHRAPHRPSAVPPAVVVLPGSLRRPFVPAVPPAAAVLRLPGCRIASAGWCPV